MHVRHGALLLPPGAYERMQKQRRARDIEQRIGAEIAKVYPGHLFQVTVDADHGYVYIDHPALASNRARYLVHQSESIRKVLMMCGEILERINIPRGEIEDVRAYDAAEPLTKDAFRVH